MKLFFKFLFACSVLFASGAQAATMTYRDRTQFEAALAAFSTDTFTDVPQGIDNFIDRGDYEISGDFYGCVQFGDCGSNDAIGFSYPGYMWLYDVQTLTFDTAINAVGRDFGRYAGGTTTITLGGFTGPTAASSTFFGIISDVAFTQISFDLSAGTTSLYDNLTYGTISSAPAVPLPAGLPLMLAGLAAFAGLRSRHRNA